MGECLLDAAGTQMETQKDDEIEICLLCTL